jgi:uncharacterized membrane protein YbjE (DUF340 family)
LAAPRSLTIFPRAAGDHAYPGLVRRSRSTALGLCGATSMDFTLPVLQRSGGVEIVPAAIVHGFLSLLVPVLMAFFSA